MADLDKLVEELSKLSVLEAAQLVKKLEESLGRFCCCPGSYGCRCRRCRRCR